jgi:hypothetical protein
MEKKIELAKALANNWVANYTLSGRMAFLANEKKLEAICHEAKSLGIYDDVYDLANKVMKGQAI